MNILGEFQAVNFGKTAASTAIKFRLKDTNPHKHVGEIWRDLRKRRLHGRMVLGDADPDQMTLGEGMDSMDRPVINGVFDTHNPSFTEEEASLRFTFNAGEIDSEEMLQFRCSRGWLVIDEITEIPDESSNGQHEPDENQSTLEFKQPWAEHPVAGLGLADNLVQFLFDAGVKDTGTLMQVIDGTHDSIKKLTDLPGIAKGRADTIQQKATQFVQGFAT